jgi:hypothetical protein
MYPTRPAQRTYLPRRLCAGACVSALAAADLAVLENLRSLITFEAAWAAFFPVCRGFFGMIVLFLGGLAASDPGRDVIRLRHRAGHHVLAATNARPTTAGRSCFSRYLTC